MKIQRQDMFDFVERADGTILPKSGIIIAIITITITIIIFVGLCGEMYVRRGWDHFAQKRHRTETRVCMCEPIAGRKGKNGRWGWGEGWWVGIFCAKILQSPVVNLAKTCLVLTKGGYLMY